MPLDFTDCGVAPACVYDRAVPVDALATAYCSLAGQPVGVAARTEALLTAVELKYGLWDADGAAARAWRRGFSDAFREAFSAMPLVLAQPCPSLRYAVVSGSWAATLDGSGRVAGTLNCRGLSAATAPLAADPRTPFYWDRPARAVPCRDAVSAQALGPALAGISDITFARQLTRPRKGPGSVDVNSHWIIGALAEAGFDRNTRPPTRCAYAAGTLLARYRWIAGCGFTMAALRLFDPAIIRLATQAGNKLTYHWLAAVGEPDRVAVSLRRQQFCRAYPELVRDVAAAPAPVPPGGQPPRPDGTVSAIAAAVDRADRIGPLVAAHRQWPKWVGKNLQGRLTATGALGRVFHKDQEWLQSEEGRGRPLGDEIAQLMAALGPAWRLRGGDSSIAAFMAKTVAWLGLDASSVAALCPSPGGTPSPWKRAWRRLPADIRARPSVALFARNHAGQVKDAVEAFERDVAQPLVALCGGAAPAPPQRATRPGSANLRDCALGRLSLAALFGISADWHARPDAIRRAKQGAPPRNGTGPSRWDPLFAPFSLVRGHVGVACLTTAAELEANGSEMGHCVRNYAMSCLEGRCHIVGFYLDGRAAATAELSGSTDLGFTAVQMRGRRNGDAPAETRQALDLILRELNGGAPARQPAGARCGAGVAACRDADPAGARPLAAPSFRPMGLAVTPDAVLADALAGRQEALARHRASLSANYEVSDPEAVDRVATAWRFAMPDRMRAAWEAGRTPAERIAAAGAVLLQEKRRRLQTSAESLAEHRGQAAHP